MQITDLHKVKAEQSKQNPYPPCRKKDSYYLNHPFQKTFGPPFSAPPAQISIYMSDGKFVVGPTSTYMQAPPVASHRVKNEVLRGHTPLSRTQLRGVTLQPFIVFSSFPSVLIKVSIYLSVRVILFACFVPFRAVLYTLARSLFVRPAAFGHGQTPD
ncbi:hypothetical protein GGI35DRAFT_110723 [Trichoderma velutinum]